MVVKLIKRLKYQLIDAPRGRGRRYSPTDSERDFKAGRWDYLYSIEELGHYMVLLGYVTHFGPDHPSILDVGCGQGRLLQLLKLWPFQSWLGMDISPNAIERAKALGIPNTCFVVGSFEEWHPESQFDLIIFNESLHYANNPRLVLETFEKALKPGGKFIVSIHHYGNHRRIWRTFDTRYRTFAIDTVENSRRQRWTVKVLGP